MSHLSRRRLGTVSAVVGSLLIVPVLASEASAGPATVPRAVQPAAAVTSWVPGAPVRLTIKTDNGAAITSLDNYVKGSVTVRGVTRRMQIKGRGHSTWTWPKKPYKFKLNNAATLLGMPAETDWNLLANYADRAALRNRLALQLGGRTRLAWSPRSRFVDVVLNGKRQGLYLLTEQVEQSARRVNLPSGGLLLEVDARFKRQGDPGFVSGHKIPIAFKDPDELTAAQVGQVKAAVAKFEAALYAPTFKDPTVGYRAYADVKTFVDWYLVNELFKNVDSDFYSSVNVTWSPGGRFAMGPPWDFDLSAGYNSRFGATAKSPIGWWTRPGEAGTHPLHSAHWIGRMFKDPAFASQVRTRWAQLRPTVDQMINQIPAAGAALNGSAQWDWTRWHTGGRGIPGGIHVPTYTGEVRFLQSWLRTRADWMSSKRVAFRRTALTVPESAGLVRLPVLLGGSATTPATVRYAVTGGTATEGTDFTVGGGGTLAYTGGTTTRLVPLTIKNDTRREGPETVRITLSAPSAGTVLGVRKTITVTIARND